MKAIDSCLILFRYKFANVKRSQSHSQRSSCCANSHFLLVNLDSRKALIGQNVTSGHRPGSEHRADSS